MTHQQARIVIIGSGICGSSIAYHLALLGWTDIILLEQGPLGSGTTSHAPGLIGQLRSNPTLVALLKDSVMLYRDLTVDNEPGFFEVGSIRAASSKARMAELERQNTYAPTVGLATQMLTPEATQAFFPLMDTKGLEGSLYLPTDGSARAPILATAMLNKARDLGVDVRERMQVNGISVINGRVRGVKTAAGFIQTDIVVAATGIWSSRIGAMAGVAIPLQPMQHQVIWTDTLPELVGKPSMANLRDPDNLVYYRQDGDSLVLGGYERTPRAFDIATIPENDNPTKHIFDENQFATLLQGGIKRVPRFETAQMVKKLNGIESFTPDGEFILGEAPEVGGFWTACGFCAHGISGAGGVGKVMAEWIVSGDPGKDMSRMDIKRFGGKSLPPEELLQRTEQIYIDYYSKVTTS